MSERNGLSRAQKILYVVVLAFGILGSLYGLGNFLFFSQAEGDTLKAEFLNHRDWGNEKYKEIMSRLDDIDEGIDSLRSYRLQTLYELKELNRQLKFRGIR